MRIAYFDCFSGVAGNMILGALLDAGVSEKELRDELRKLNLSGYEIKVTPTVKNNIRGTRLDISLEEKHPSRNLGDIYKIIDGSSLNPAVKTKSKRIFERLAEAEAKIHRKSIDEIHFHEVGAVDAILDIVGSVAGLKLLGVEEVYTSPFPLGHGTVTMAHGTFPIPAPATVELLKGFPVFNTSTEGELVTPTGAAIVTTLAKGSDDIPPMKLERVGYGAGTFDYKVPNLLRIVVGETILAPEESVDTVIETNLDDMNPQFYNYVMERLFAAGAAEVYLIPVQMKKGRPGTVLRIIGRPDQVDAFLDILFSETTTLGVRILEVKRKKLEKEVVEIETRYGKARVKLGKLAGEIKNLAPEYEDCQRYAEGFNLPLKEVYDEIKREALSKLKEPHLKIG